VAGRIMSMKNSNDTIGNRTRDLLTCSAVSQPTALPRVPNIYIVRIFIYCIFKFSSFVAIILRSYRRFRHFESSQKTSNSDILRP